MSDDADDEDDVIDMPDSSDDEGDKEEGEKKAAASPLVAPGPEAPINTHKLPEIMIKTYEEFLARRQKAFHVIKSSRPRPLFY